MTLLPLLSVLTAVLLGGGPAAPTTPAVPISPTPPSASVFTPDLRLPGLLPDEPTDVQIRFMAGMLLIARDELADVRSETLAEPWPCVGDDAVFGFMTPNSPQAYTALKAALRAQGWTLERELLAPSVIPKLSRYSFMWRRGDRHIIGVWGDAVSGNRSTLVACRRAEHWKPAPPPAPAATAPKLALPFVAETEGWSGGPRGLRLTALDENDEPRLVARGEVTAAGRLTLGLPGRPDPALLRPASEWAGVFGASECDAPGGRVTVSDPRALLLAVDEATVLRAVPATGATAAQVLAAPTDGERTLVNAGMFDGGQVVRRVRLVYSSGPVTLRGTLACPGEPPLKIDVALPGGWSAVVQEDHLPDTGAPFQTLGNPTGGQERRGWREWSF